MSTCGEKWSIDKISHNHATFFGKAGRNKRVGRKYFLNFINEQAENLRAGWKKNPEKSKQACCFIGTREYLPVTRFT